MTYDVFGGTLGLTQSNQSTTRVVAFLSFVGLCRNCSRLLIKKQRDSCRPTAVECLSHFWTCQWKACTFLQNGEILLKFEWNLKKNYLTANMFINCCVYYNHTCIKLLQVYLLCIYSSVVTLETDSHLLWSDCLIGKVRKLAYCSSDLAVACSF